MFTKNRLLREPRPLTKAAAVRPLRSARTGHAHSTSTATGNVQGGRQTRTTRPELMNCSRSGGRQYTEEGTSRRRHGPQPAAHRKARSWTSRPGPAHGTAVKTVLGRTGARLGRAGDVVDAALDKPACARPSSCAKMYRFFAARARGRLPTPCWKAAGRAGFPQERLRHRGRWCGHPVVRKHLFSATAYRSRIRPVEFVWRPPAPRSARANGDRGVGIPPARAWLARSEAMDRNLFAPGPTSRGWAAGPQGRG